MRRSLVLLAALALVSCADIGGATASLTKTSDEVRILAIDAQSAVVAAKATATAAAETADAIGDLARQAQPVVAKLGGLVDDVRRIAHPIAKAAKQTTEPESAAGGGPAQPSGLWGVLLAVLSTILAIWQRWRASQLASGVAAPLLRAVESLDDDTKQRVKIAVLQEQHGQEKPRTLLRKLKAQYGIGGAHGH